MFHHWSSSGKSSGSLIHKGFAFSFFSLLLHCTSSAQAKTDDWTQLAYYDFENDIKNEWVLSNKHATHYMGGTYAYEGNGAIKLRKGKEDESPSFAMQKNNLRASTWHQLRIRFWFIAGGFDNHMEQLHLDLSRDGGNMWLTTPILSLAYEDDFLNDQFVKAVAVIDTMDFAFTDKMKLRIRCVSSSKRDRVYVDEVKISARNVASRPSPTYKPGFLKDEDENGIRWSVGLEAIILAESDFPVMLADGSTSDNLFHWYPDAGAAFPLQNDNGGWVLISNSEADSLDAPNAGGVGALYFNGEGHLIKYEWILHDTKLNCGGGKTPWNTWISCEENGRLGRIFEVDPKGSMQNTSSSNLLGGPSSSSSFGYGRITCLGEGGGNFESAAFDGRRLDMEKCAAGDLSLCKVDFFVTHDAEHGEIRKYTPTKEIVQRGLANANYLSILETNDGDYVDCLDKRRKSMKYLKITSGSGGTYGSFEWNTSKEEGRQSAFENYPYNEGIDVKDGRMYVVSKTLKALFIFNLDDETWIKTSTQVGAFSGQPDQVKVITKSLGGMIYFTEEARRSGVHALNEDGEYVTIFKSTGEKYKTMEVTGLAFSPNKRHMYFAFQGIGHLFDVVRSDGYPFDGLYLDIKYHNA